jgi:hypothetical protein
MKYLMAEPGLTDAALAIVVNVQSGSTSDFVNEAFMKHALRLKELSTVVDKKMFIYDIKLQAEKSL